MPPMEGTSLETTLMQRVKTGDEQAFRTLVTRHLPKAHSIAQRVLHSHADAQEAVQDAFSKVWINATCFDASQASFGTWFYRILTNTCLDMARKSPPIHTDIEQVENTLHDTSKPQDEALSHREQNAHIRAVVQTLPNNQRMAVVLCYFEDMTNQEAAAIMKLHVKALEGLLTRARKTLREQLDEPWIPTNATLKTN